MSSSILFSYCVFNKNFLGHGLYKLMYDVSSLKGIFLNRVNLNLTRVKVRSDERRWNDKDPFLLSISTGFKEHQ